MSVPDAPPPEEVMRVATPEQFKAMAHPLRQRLLFALIHPATISQLATATGSQKGNIAHHLKVLRKAGMVRVVATRTVRGGTEQYYQRTVRRYDLSGEQATAHTPLLVRAVADELAGAAPEPFLVLRNIRLTADQVTHLTDELTRLSAELTDAGPDEHRYGLLLTLYQPAQPEPGTDAP
ncbi:helix-turn-helix domain-containing protein [Dactylosporangium sp. NPDC048998]|uniref:helix-turn-helix domain-containing protein n=1 Tax=Dactylosporangium sp. NPDC048998 TaxID=3363976 RepID=UPI0037179046